MVGALLVMQVEFLAFVVHMEKVASIFEERRCIRCRFVEMLCIAVCCILIEVDDVGVGLVDAAVFFLIARPALLASKVAALVYIDTSILRWRLRSSLLELRVDL